MKDYQLILSKAKEELNILQEKKTAQLKLQEYESASIIRDQENKMIDQIKDILLEMNVDIEAMPLDDSERENLQTLWQDCLEHFGFDNTKKINTLQLKNIEINDKVEQLKGAKNKLLAQQNFTEANQIGDKILALTEKVKSNERKIKGMQ
jgi:protein-arginine kinase activator protein McsA